MPRSRSKGTGVATQGTPGWMLAAKERLDVEEKRLEESDATKGNVDSSEHDTQAIYRHHHASVLHSAKVGQDLGVTRAGQTGARTSITSRDASSQTYIPDKI